MGKEYCKECTCAFCGNCIHCKGHSSRCPIPVYEEALQEFRMRRDEYVLQKTASQRQAYREAERIATEEFYRNNPEPPKPLPLKLG